MTKPIKALPSHLARAISLLRPLPGYLRTVFIEGLGLLPSMGLSVFGAIFFVSGSDTDHDFIMILGIFMLAWSLLIMRDKAATDAKQKVVDQFLAMMHGAEDIEMRVRYVISTEDRERIDDLRDLFAATGNTTPQPTDEGNKHVD